MDPTVPSLLAVLGEVPDPRRARGRRHACAALLLLVVAALLSGANSQRAIARWAAHLPAAARRRLGCARPRAPSEPTLRRLLQRVDADRLERVVGAWQQQVRAGWHRAASRWLDGIAVDGKTLRGARRLGARDAHLVSACCQRHAFVLGEVAVADATDELRALGPLLERLVLAGETVTFDALFTHAVVAEAVVARGGAYLMVVKDNQPTLRRACAEATTPPLVRPARQLGRARTTRLAHGRIETRTLWAAAAPPDFGLPFARQVLRLHRRRVDKRTGQVLTDETVFAATSLAPDLAPPASLLRLWQRHWSIENALHWVRDAVFAEDASTTRTGSAPRALAALRNLAIGLLHRWKRPDVTAARQYFGGHPGVLFRRLGLPTTRQ
jgi:predicted transposase YbfD/YdcC